MTTSRISLHRSAVLLGVLALLLGLASAMLAPNFAQAQTPAVCDEYPDLPVCDEDDQGKKDDTSSGEDPVAGGGGPSGNAGDGDGDGSLPFTGYPVTDLILLLLLLLAGGLAIRGYLAIRERLANNHSSA